MKPRTFVTPHEVKDWKLTILSLSAISSSSSFFLCSKWASIRACSSIRSLFWRFFWMSCRTETRRRKTLRNAQKHSAWTEILRVVSPGLLTSKSTFSPSGIFGALGLRDSVWVLSAFAHRWLTMFSMLSGLFSQIAQIEISIEIIWSQFTGERNLLELWLLLCRLRNEEGTSTCHRVRNKADYFISLRHCMDSDVWF